MQNFLTNRGLLDDDLEAEIDERIETQLTEAVESVEAATTDPATMFDHVYDVLPARLREQRAELESLREKYGDDAFHEVLE